MAVWDDFLSERDREHLAAGWQKTVPFGLGRRGALVVVDNFASMVGDERESVVDATAVDPGRYGSEAWDALERTRDLLSGVRELGAIVVHTTIEDPVPTGVFGRVPRRFEFHELTAPLPAERIVRKAHASAFFGTALASHLRTDDVDTVVLCGNSTSGCVRATAVDAAQHGFRVAVVEDCVFDRTEASHAINLFDIDQKYGDVITAAAALDYFAHSAASGRD